MQRLVAVLVLCAVVLLGTVTPALAPAVLAQSVTGPLPAADELGLGWITIPDTRPTGGPDYPEAWGWYVGPEGARIELFASRPHARSVDTIWQDIAQAIDTDDSSHRRDHFPPDTPPIAGCTDARRVESDDPTFHLLREATTACRTADTIVRTNVSGTWHDLTGVAASDALAQLVLAAIDRSERHDPAPQATDALAPLLPTSGELPAGLILDEQGSRTAEEIASGFTAPDEARERLTVWGWQANAYRTFVAGPGAQTTTPSRLEVSIHRFAWPTGAAWALPYFAQGRAVALDQVEVSPALLRPDEAAVTGPNETTRYVRVGALLVRVTAVAQPGPANAGVLAAAEATAAAHAVIENAGLSWPSSTCR